MIDAYGNDMSRDQAEAELIKFRLKRKIYANEEERMALVFRRRMLLDDGR